MSKQRHRLAYHVQIHSLRSTGKAVTQLDIPATAAALQGELVDGEHLVIGLLRETSPGLAPCYNNMKVRHLLFTEWDFERPINSPHLYLTSAVLDLHATGSTIEVGTGLQARDRGDWNPWRITLTDDHDIGHRRPAELVSRTTHSIGLWYQRGLLEPRVRAATLTVEILPLSFPSTETGYIPTNPYLGAEPQMALREIFFPRKLERASSENPDHWLRVLVATGAVLEDREVASRSRGFAATTHPRLLSEEVTDRINATYGPRSTEGKDVRARWLYLRKLLKDALPTADVRSNGPHASATTVLDRAKTFSRSRADGIALAVAAIDDALVAEVQADQTTTSADFAARLCAVLMASGAVPGSAWPSLDDVATDAAYHSWRNR